MSKSKFLLIAPKAFELYKLIVVNLEYMGYEVIHIEDSGYPFRYRSLSQRLYNFIRKIFFKDKSYKSKIRKDFVTDKQMSILCKEERYDVGLIIRTDFFDKKLVEKAKDKTDYLISFHFDGISRDLVVLDYVSIFDQFYVFDPADVRSFPDYCLEYSPNFYFDYPDPLLDVPVRKKTNNVYYVSSHHLSREQDLVNIHKYLSKKFDSVDFVVVCQKKNLEHVSTYIRQHMRMLHDHVTFEEQLHSIIGSEIIIDLVIADHKGYSFRIFEGLKFSKKVITTNSTIKEADFYHPNNFFVLTDNNWEALDEFLDSDFVQLDKDLLAKYSFSNWLNSKLKNNCVNYLQ